MARTSLFGALKRALAAAHAANVTQLTPEELARRAVSRRSVLRGMGAAAMIPLVPRLAGCTGDPAPPLVEDVAIVGGGMAGLHCAYRLKQVGVIAKVYEASDRAGGRMYTGRDLPMIQGGQLFEYGGELIDTEHTTMMGLAAEFGLALDDLPADTAGLRSDTFYFNGSLIADAAIVAEFMPLAARMATTVTAAEADDSEFARVDSMSITEWLAGEGMVPPTSLISQILIEAYTGEYGLECDEQSIFNLLYLIDYDSPDPFRIFGDSDEHYHTHAGNDSITSHLAMQLDPDQLQLGYRLTGVEQRGPANFALAFDTGGGGSEQVVARRVVFALPFTALRRCDLTAAGFTPEKLDIVQNLGYGTNAKLMLQFQTRTWRTLQSASGSCFTDVGELQSTWETTRGQTGAQGIITNFVGGDRGVEIGTGTVASRAAEAVGWFDTLFPGAQAAYIDGSAVLKHWPSEPFHLGSYACYRPTQWSYFGLEGQRIGNMYFCGEHTSQDYQGYMEGAAESGALVAMQIMRALHLTPPARLSQLMAPKLVLPQACYDAPAVTLRRNQRRRLARDRAEVR